VAIEPRWYDDDRYEMLPYVPAGARRVLDVGCDSGRFANHLRERDKCVEVWGIDPGPHPPGIADPYVCRITGQFPADAPMDVAFDCIVFNDVLEHMIDPWSALESARGMLSTDGTVVASIPNVRNIQVLRTLAVNGRWRYTDTGILDRTHLRFFTRDSIVTMFDDAGFEILALDPINPNTRGRWAATNRLLRGRLDDLLALQFAVVGQPFR
jgi:2-polyprenyl-3-methyl-5-hydroxy-6-metoxy-1,4-benzoquinol methylase